MTVCRSGLIAGVLRRETLGRRHRDRPPAGVHRVIESGVQARAVWRVAERRVARDEHVALPVAVSNVDARVPEPPHWKMHAGDLDYRPAKYAIAWNSPIGHDYLMSGGIRRVIRPPFKHWWLVGVLLLCGLVAVGWMARWSAGFLAVAGIVAVLYAALPPMEAARQQMLGSKTASVSTVRNAESMNDHSSGGAMVWDTRITPVVHALSMAINDLAVIRNIAIRSGISLAYVPNMPDAESYWTAVLERAQDEGDQRVDSVLNEALVRTQNPSVRDAIEIYWKARGR